MEVSSKARNSEGYAGRPVVSAGRRSRPLTTHGLAENMDMDCSRCQARR